ncbi:MICOS complex subunit Mic27-like isoform X2 [Amphibalanus amphitrite]|nr:MICOS complex subunit Mic27-like isoform X2 [Amphibalanus amphitrite]XP_043233932.1 MICOS complex subunit Mic27-like isoform X2 [Amphibalanus amphitrite]XP_043233933.1 MICOS complex subunit Mic27-like isoform X2 [Amphibalanus amphitrite]XP_043233934.1 MICOS complex subunit Mic27-like isoform X2 [Amphibalanus amphitrite]XP_043233935.1 MICOS complex subunit Mic27-like isoform X2 [Amphibalanus amphitrite]XP_043233936.1 MICOS complex subunit Mic27-like isoform X2 [Amphibalanus amphitrite]
MFLVYAKSRNGNNSATLIRPSELPTYDEFTDGAQREYGRRPAGVLQQSVGEARRAAADFLAQYRQTFDRARHVVETGRAHTAGALDYLRHETNPVARTAAITAGGLAGLLAAALRRRGLLQRLLYTGVGLTVPTSACYPRETAAFGRWTLDQSEKYASIAYNFLVGAKPDGSAPPSPAPASKRSASEREAVQAPPAAAQVPPSKRSASEREAVQAPPAAARPALTIAPVVPDPGQSQPEDDDLYTTRSG